MVGDFFGGTSTGIRGSLTIDRLLVVADDLDSPFPLPGANSVLNITEPGPVGMFDTSVASIQEIQQILRAGGALPPATLVGQINDNATLTTSMTVSQIQALLASTPQAYDIISLIAPPGSYANEVNGIFQGRNQATGTTEFDQNGSGALIQNGGDALNGGEDLDAFYFYDYNVNLNVSLPSASGGGVGRLKIAEGGSVLPQNRLYFRYSYFDDVAYTTNGLGISRFTPGFERTFYDNLLSFELRAPFASGTATNITADAGASFGSTESHFGNLTMYLKALLLSRGKLACSGGLGIETPTADGISVTIPGQQPLLTIDNQTVHLQPFLGWLYTPSDKCFLQGFAQFDFAVGGNDVYANLDGNGLSHAGTLYDQDSFFFDLGIGYWLYRNDASKCLTGIIPMLEYHHVTSLSNEGVVNAGPLQIGNFVGDTRISNFVAATTFELNKRNQITVAYAGPLDSSNDRQHQGSFRLMVGQSY
jgi:hypothetical protein